MRAHLKPTSWSRSATHSKSNSGQLLTAEPSRTASTVNVGAVSFSNPLLPFEEIEAAAGRLAGVTRRTPLLTSRTIDEMSQRAVVMKAENFQCTGSFKMRGAYNAIAALKDDGVLDDGTSIVTFSSGNHGQAVARSAQLLEVRATVVMPSDAPEVKRSAVRSYGATIVEYDRVAEDREEVATAVAARLGATIVPPFNNHYVIAGQGTCGKEIIEDSPPLDAVAVCLGGGGLLSGIATAFSAMSPGTKVIGVEPATANDGQMSLEAGKLMVIDQPRTIADGQATRSLGDLTFAVIKQRVNKIVTVTESEIVEAMRLCFDRLRIVVEPSGATALAAVMAGKVGSEGDRVAATLSGGNVDRARFARLLVDGAAPETTG
ncbi:MAG: pyridoxal-phosphate dependent enzyme [Actinobacteria bacterium]|nr:pyridoxal-phosphate dependent enzyme [Actinomycetota bacterium]